MIYIRLFYLWCFTYFIYGSVWSQAQRIQVDELKRIVYYLASEELQGRGTNTPGEQAAADFLVQEMTRIGLKPYPALGDYQHVFEFSYSANPFLGENAERIQSRGINVVGFLYNGAEKTIVIGAHYDHLGTGELRGSREKEPLGKIHYGADDNASGVAGVLALAEYLANNERTESFNFLFALFSAEELGLIGSKKLVEELEGQLENFVFMINMDMIGRLDPEKKKLYVGGIGTAAEWGMILQDISHSFEMVYDSSGTGGSDHTSFYRANIPVINFFTGLHDDYHKSSDTPDKLNYEGQAEILEYILELIHASEQVGKLTFQETKTRMTGASRFKVAMGIHPDYSWQKPGVKIDGVVEDKPASKAGIMAGDILTKVGDKVIQSIGDYMEVLGKYEPGNEVKVIILRDEKEYQLSVTF